MKTASMFLLALSCFALTGCGEDGHDMQVVRPKVEQVPYSTQRETVPGGPLGVAPSTEQQVADTPTTDPLTGASRFVVTRAFTFTDKLAYGGERGVYTLIDRQTKKEFVGISGVGIAETGVHRSGKTSREDER